MGNIGIIVFCLLTGGYVLYETGTYPPQADPSMDAGLYLKLLVAALFILTALFAAKLVMTRKAAAGRKSAASRKALIMAACMAGYCAMMAFAGYALATVIFVAVGVLLFNGSPRDGLVTGICATAALELLFRLVFKVPLPEGLLGLI